jgi:hypothetical protein
MKRHIRYIFLPLIVISVAAALLVTGCDQIQPNTGTPAAGGSALTETELNQIIADAVLALPDAGTYKFRMDVGTDMEVTGGPDAGKGTMTMDAAGEIDEANAQMRMDIDISIDVPGTPESSRDITSEIYVLSDFIYLKADIPGLGEQWMKAPRTEEMMDTFDINIINEQLATLVSPAGINLAGYETIDGSECYVIKLVPDYHQLEEFVRGFQATNVEIDWDKVGDIAEVFKELSYTAWIATDTKLLKKMDGSLVLEMTPEQVGSTDDFDKLKIDITLGIELYDYGAPASIVLPEEAGDAIEVPQG